MELVVEGVVEVVVGVVEELAVEGFAEVVAGVDFELDGVGVVESAHKLRCVVEELVVDIVVDATEDDVELDVKIKINRHGLGFTSEKYQLNLPDRHCMLTSPSFTYSQALFS